MSFHNPFGKYNSLVNKRNVSNETLGIILLVSKDDMTNPHHIISEPADHTFGSTKGYYSMTR